MPRTIPCRMMLSLLSLAMLSPGAARGQEQFAGNQTIVTTGRETLEVPAQRMLLSVDLIARHQDVREAARLLQDRIEASKTQVAALGAAKDSVKIGDPKVSAAQSAAQQNLRVQIMQGFGRAGRSTDEMEVDSMVTVTARLTAEWELVVGDAVEQMAAVYELQQQIRAAGLSGADDTTGLSAEEQELLDEAQLMMTNDYYSDGEQQPGEPRFLFYAPISAEDRDRALRQAFEIAQSQAAQLAKAAGVGLGELVSLQDAASASLTEAYALNYSYDNADYSVYQMAAELLPSHLHSPMAFGAGSGTLTYTVQLTAGFRIVP